MTGVQTCALPIFAISRNSSAFYRQSRCFAKTSPWQRDAPPKPPINDSQYLVLSVASGGGAVVARKVRNPGILMKSRKFHEVPRFREISIKQMTPRGATSGKGGGPRGPRGAPLDIRNRANITMPRLELIALSRRFLNSERISLRSLKQGFSASQNQA